MDASQILKLPIHLTAAFLHPTGGAEIFKMDKTLRCAAEIAPRPRLISFTASR